MISRFRVAAGILRDSRGRVLIAERVGGGPFQGMWEFPGGKIGDGESPEQALERELLEELGIELGAVECFMHLEHDYPDRSVSIDFFLVRAWSNEPAGLEGQALRWVSPEQLGEQNILPADVPVIEALQQMAS
ncbi:MAG: 8-oxo-dGTP diphosphatase MutT [Gammaproteobacteria bacterium]|jgi:8-oxo-dGTP diphosphatase|nr:8-oxo-dGTP diphosphatase MutT [Gammaproteobacteria bacterium]